MKPEIIQNNEFIEVIGHYDDEVQCAKMTLLAELYSVEHRDGYAKFRLDDADKLGLVNERLEFPPPPSEDFGHYNINVLETDYSGIIGNSAGITITYPITLVIAYNASLIYFDSSDNKTHIGFVGAAFGFNASADGNIVDKIKSLEYWTTADSTKRTVNYVQEGDDKQLENNFSFALNSYNDYLYINIITEDPTPRISIDLATLSGWSGLSDGNHSITVKAKATGYRDSEASQAVSVTKAPAGYTVTITAFTDSTISTNTNVRVYDGTDDSAPLLATLNSTDEDVERSVFVTSGNVFLLTENTSAYIAGYAQPGGEFNEQASASISINANTAIDIYYAHRGPF